MGLPRGKHGVRREVLPADVQVHHAQGGHLRGLRRMDSSVGRRQKQGADPGRASHYGLLDREPSPVDAPAEGRDRSIQA